MDYDDNEFQGQNLQLAGEGRSKVSPVLRPYALPKFDFDDSLQGHLRFDSLVENEVFLGITSQEDNQWIEEYSSGVESRRNNVWSEATSSESVEMLLKSVGQEERVAGETIIEQLDACDVPGSLTKVMDPTLGNFPVVTSEKCNLSVSEEKVESTCDDVIQKKTGNSENASVDKELAEDPSVSRAEFTNPRSLENIGASIEELKVQENLQQVSVNASGLSENFKCEENRTSVQMDSGTMIVESCSFSVEKPPCVVSAVENPLVDAPICSAEPSEGSKCAATASLIFSEVDRDLEDNKHEESPAASENAGNFELRAVQYGNTNIELQVEPVVTMESDKNSSPETSDGAHLLSGSVATADTVTDDQPKSPILGVSLVHLDNKEKAEVGFPFEGNSENNTSKNPSSVVEKEAEEASPDLAEKNALRVAFHCATPVESHNASLSEQAAEANSPILGVSLVHQDKNEKVQVGFPFEGNSQNDASKNPSSLVEKEAEASPDLTDKNAHEIAIHSATQVESHNASLSEQAAEANTGGQERFKTSEMSPCESSETGGGNSEAGGMPDPKESMPEVDKSSEHQTSVHVTCPSEPEANHIGQYGGSVSSLDKLLSVSPLPTSSMELSQCIKDKLEVAKSVVHDKPLPSKASDDVEGNVQSVSSSSATQEEKSFTFEVGKSAGLGQPDKGFQSNPTFQPSNVPAITKGPSVNSSSCQVDAEKLHEASPVSPHNPSGVTPQVGVKVKSERKTRRKSVGKESARKGNQPKEITHGRDSKRVEKSSVLLTPVATSQVIQFEEVKSNENDERSGTKPSGVRPVSSPKLPDLNNSTTIFQQPFTDNQQVQLRAQILVYGSLISGGPPEESHMTAAFGQSVYTDVGRRTWEGVWRAYLERLHVQKAQASRDTPMQSRSDSGNKADQGIKRTSVQNKIPLSPIGVTNKGTPPIVSPMIPLSSPLWNILTPSSEPSGIPRTTRLDYQALSPLHPYQTPTMGHNPSWLSAGQWVASSPIPAFNIVPRFPSLPINETVKLTPVKESGGPGMNHTSTPVAHSVFPASSGPPSSDSKSRKRKKGSASENVKQLSEPSPAQMASISAPLVIHSAQDPPTSRRSGDQNAEKVVISKDTLSKVEESKKQAEDAAELAAATVSHCQGVWSQLGRQNNAGMNSDDEAKLASSAVSIAAAASVAKVAAAAAKIASNVAEQARSMVEVFLASKSDQSSTSSLGNKFNKVETASASSKHAENLDAIVKAAELAAEAVSQAGKIVAMGDPLPLGHLVEAGPEGYWKTPRLAFKRKAVLNLNNSSDKRIIEAATNVSDKEIPSVKRGLSGDFAENQIASHGKVMKKLRVRKGHDLSKTIRVGQNKPNVTTDTLKENNIKEGCLVEVYKDDDKCKGAWFGANVLSVKDGKALVCYTEIQTDEGQLKEWMPLEPEGIEAPKIRVAHPMTTMRLEGTRKRRRTAVTDFAWSSGDQVDVWIQDRWQEGVVVETNKIDVTSLTIRFPGQGETLVVPSWNVRPTLIWKDGKWIEGHTSEGRLSFQGDTPQEKRQKLGSSVVESKTNDGPSKSIDLVDPKKQEESRILPLSAQESLFTIGSTRDDTKRGARRTVKSGLQKEGPRVVFGVPKPGKKQKFMDVSQHYVADGSNKIEKPHDSVKFTRYLIPQAAGSRGWKSNPKTDPKEKQTAETKPRKFQRKPPIPSKSATREATITNKTSRDSVSDDENQSGRENQTEHGSSSNIEDANLVSSLEVKRVFISSNKSERLNKRKIAPAKVEKPLPEHVEPRRSNRKIQPTSRLLEGLQSSMTISKIPASSHSSQRSHSKVTPKGNTNNG